ncbi:hypothetical protein B0J13DRAFT_298185 [Dactylonectria estremocensis]|uniref:Uncharacterized protein n=1 Tax=Dactylonectria estremocensis TaxID=1079267 RepID=A0A9P9J5P3_9HYPO|nr:hypothetical protein B0J13DRAFT_298185 [Dactylonectria estremocensis]
MGLPLFVAPVESDLPFKATDKNSSASPSRYGIRRHARQDSRERRATSRRHTAIRDVLRDHIGDAGVRRLSYPYEGGRPTMSSRPLPESVAINDLQSDDRHSRPFREVLREMVRSDERSRERFEEHLHGLFGSDSRGSRSSENNEIEDVAATIGWWTGDPFPHLNRTQTTGSLDSRRDGEVRPRSRQRIPPPNGQQLTQLNRDPTTMGLRRGTDPRAHSLMMDTEDLERQRMMLIRQLRGTNAFGERERSLSPEGWDTLLTTLTPDPQPPSAGSSFHSTVASQSAGVSSRTSLTGPELAAPGAADQACESGCEGSDTEGADLDQPSSGRVHRRRDEMRRVRVRVPDYNLDGTLDTSDSLMDLGRYPVVDHMADHTVTRRLRFASSLASDREANRPRRERNGPVIRRETGTLQMAEDGPMSIPHFGRARHGWVGHLSVGTSDDEQGTERRSLNRESSATSANFTNPDEEEWAGMQRIVRSLARREDIPDGWWAEAGLSRTLPQDGTD